MKQDPKPTMPGALAQAFANAVIHKGQSKPVEHARTTVVMPNQYVIKPSKEKK